MTLEQAIATQPQWVQLWTSWMGIVILGTMLVLLFSKTTWRDAVIIFATSVLAFFAMNWLYDKVGMVRLLGIVHVFLWTPLAIYFWHRLKNPEIGPPFRQVLWVFLATIIASLAFDYVDVARYALGERGSMIPVASSPAT